jgi:hypothetical protein
MGRRVAATAVETFTAPTHIQLDCVASFDAILEHVGLQATRLD